MQQALVSEPSSVYFRFPTLALSAKVASLGAMTYPAKRVEVPVNSRVKRLGVSAAASLILVSGLTACGNGDYTVTLPAPELTTEPIYTPEPEPEDYYGPYVPVVYSPASRWFPDAEFSWLPDHAENLDILASIMPDLVNHGLWSEFEDMVDNCLSVHPEQYIMCQCTQALFLHGFSAEELMAEPELFATGTAIAMQECAWAEKPSEYLSAEARAQIEATTALLDGIDSEILATMVFDRCTNVLNPEGCLCAVEVVYNRMREQGANDLAILSIYSDSEAFEELFQLGSSICLLEMLQGLTDD